MHSLPDSTVGEAGRLVNDGTIHTLKITDQLSCNRSIAFHNDAAHDQFRMEEVSIKPHVSYACNRLHIKL